MLGTQYLHSRAKLASYCILRGPSVWQPKYQQHLNSSCKVLLLHASYALQLLLYWGPHRFTHAQVAPMADKRGSHMSAVVGDSLYVMGGWDAKAYLGQLEVFDTRAGRWRSGPPMAVPRAYGATAVLDDQIYLLGGLANNVRF